MRPKATISNIAIVALLSFTALATQLLANSRYDQTEKNGKRGKVQQVSSDAEHAAKDTAKDSATAGEKTGNGVAKEVEAPGRATAKAVKAGSKGNAKAVSKTGKVTVKLARKP
ncbi:MAG TPA: hypothetical protein VLB68_11120 [Pyrinomonadaceae bacterium]|nr:hypothetical protein [Pyrinomonadaceae bacterium]